MYLTIYLSFDIISRNGRLVTTMSIKLNDIFPYVIASSYKNEKNCPPAGSIYEKRIVKWYELELILWGEGYVFTEGVKLPVKRGDIMFRQPGMRVQGIPPYYSYLVVFDMVYSPEKEGLYAENNPMNNLHGESAEVYSGEYDLPYIMNFSQSLRLEGLFMELYQHYVSESRKNQFFVRTCLMQIMAYTCAEWQKIRALQSPSRSVRINYRKIFEIRKYIEHNFSKRLKLQELADLAVLSPNFLCNIFKKITGVSIFHYINDCRINEAKKVLINTNRSIKEIAYELGFENDTYFYTLFKKKEGLSPTAYRDQHRQLIAENHEQESKNQGVSKSQGLSDNTKKPCNP